LKTLDVQGRHFIIKFDYDAALVQGARQLPSRQWDSTTKGWLVPITPATALRVLEWASSRRFTITPAAQQAIENATEIADLLYEASAAKDDPLEVIPGLRPFQRAGVAYALATRRCMIADEMGLGKTVQALAFLEGVENGKGFPAIVICPASLKLNWQREAARWLPDRTTVVINGKDADIPDGVDIYIVNYDLFGRGAIRRRNDAGKIVMIYPMVEEFKFLKAKSIVLDESHYVKNPDAHRTKACRELCAGVPNRLCLSGTPVLNRPYELISQVQMLGLLHEVFGGRRAFIDTYCEAELTRFGTAYTGAKNLDELNRKMRSSFFVRRRKADVLKELPPKVRSYVPMQLTNEREYMRAERDLIKWIMETDGMEAARRAKAAEHLVRIEKLKQLAVAGKLAGAVSWIKDFLDSGEKLVVFVTHKTVVTELQATLKDSYGAVTIDGSTSQRDRQAAVDNFQNDDTVRVLIGNLKAAGVGLTLTTASNVAFLELGWTPAEHDQAEDRVHRITQQDSVTAWYLMAANTIDADITELLESKRKVVTAATDGGEIGEGSILGDLVSRLRDRAG
jgi:SNF2 family DNA or RNA helicase